MAFSDILRLLVEADVSGAVSSFGKLEQEAGSSLNGIEKKAKSSGSATGKTFSSELKKGWGDGAGSIASDIATKLGPTAMAAGIGAGVAYAVNAASSLNEQISKTKAVFGESADGILKWSDSAATSLGQSKRDALEAVSSFGNLFMQLGLTGQAVTDMSTKMVGLATDFASFFDTDPATALEAISAAFRGEFDSVQKFVPTINAAAVEQEALKEGLAKTTKELTQQDKAVATYNLLLNGAGQATGDFAKTSDSLANTQRKLKAQVTDLAAELGNEVLPTVTKLANIASKAITFVINAKIDLPAGLELDLGKAILAGGAKPFLELAGKIKEVYTGVKKDTADAFNAIGKSADELGPKLGPAGTAVGDLARDIDTHFRGAADSVDFLARSAERMGQVIGPAGTGFGDLTRQVGSVVTSMDMVPMSADAAANAISREGSEFADIAKSAQTAADAVRDHTNAALEAAGSVLGVSAAQRDFRKALEETQELEKTGKASADELGASYDNQTQQAFDAATATAKFAVEHSNLTDKTKLAKLEQDTMIATLYDLAGTASGPTHDALVGLIGDLQDTGAQKPEPTVTLNDQATAPLTDITTAIQTVGRLKAEIAVTANTSSARSSINRLIDGLNVIHTATGGGILLGHIAQGTNNWRGGVALVGEQGPELAFLPKGTVVKTAAQTKQIMTGPSPIAMGGTGGKSTVVNIHVSGAVDPYNTARQIQTILAKGNRGGFNTLAA